MHRSLNVLAAVVTAVVLHHATILPAKGEISISDIRAIQTGNRQDFDRAKHPGLKKALRVATPSIRLSGERGTAKMVGGIEIRGVRDVVRIRYDDGQDTDWRCSGYIIANPDVKGLALVLTAGHCSCGNLNSYGFSRDEEEDRHFVLAAPPMRYAGYSCLLPPESQPGRDLALMWIKQPKDGDADGDTPVQIVPSPFIATMQQIYQDTETQRLVGIGYGLNESGKLSKFATIAMIPVQSFFCAGGRVADSVCASFREFVLADTNAAPGSNRPDSCGGDSGGPVFWAPPAASIPKGIPKGADLEKFRVLVGITSRALDGVRHNSGTTCGGGGVYTAVGHPDVVEWLSSFGVVVRGIIQ